MNSRKDEMSTPCLSSPLGPNGLSLSLCILNLGPVDVDPSKTTLWYVLWSKYNNINNRNEISTFTTPNF